jgi:hypothetical protein
MNLGCSQYLVRRKSARLRSDVERFGVTILAGMCQVIKRYDMSYPPLEISTLGKRGIDAFGTILRF